MDHSPRFLKLSEAVRARIVEISTEDIAARIAAGDRFELVDVREESEVAAGRIKGARHLSKGVIERDIEKSIPDSDAEVVLYCGGGYRSAIAAESVVKMGYPNVKSMAGGWREWKAKGFPTE
jgi:rhodanese-related sulfurtransferase